MSKSADTPFMSKSADEFRRHISENIKLDEKHSSGKDSHLWRRDAIEIAESGPLQFFTKELCSGYIDYYNKTIDESKYKINQYAHLPIYLSLQYGRTKHHIIRGLFNQIYANIDK